MADAILSVNAGSSSVKTKLYLRSERQALPIAAAQVTGLNDPPAKLTYSHGSRRTTSELDRSIVTPNDAFRYILDLLFNESGLRGLQELSLQESLRFVCHRVVHGGDYDKEVLITEESYHHVENLEDLAPL
jgi:acetate kinase